jgi:acyl carrier protein
MMTVRSTVLEMITDVGQQHGKQLAPLSDSLPLLDSGLDSLCIAVLVALLDDRFGVDPFSADSSGTLPVTIGDFVALYENAA